jgi:acyl carrier protein
MGRAESERNQLDRPRGKPLSTFAQNALRKHRVRAAGIAARGEHLPGPRVVDLTSMSKAAIYRKLEPIFRSVFDSDVVLSEELDASQVPLWDSLTHIILAVEIETQLGVRLTTEELAQLRNVGEMVTLLEQKGVGA